MFRNVLWLVAFNCAYMGLFIALPCTFGAHVVQGTIYGYRHYYYPLLTTPYPTLTFSHLLYNFPTYLTVPHTSLPFPSPPFLTPLYTSPLFLSLPFPFLQRFPWCYLAYGNSPLPPWWLTTPPSWSQRRPLILVTWYYPAFPRQL